MTRPDVAALRAALEQVRHDKVSPEMRREGGWTMLAGGDAEAIIAALAAQNIYLVHATTGGQAMSVRDDRIYEAIHFDAEGHPWFDDAAFERAGWRITSAPEPASGPAATTADDPVSAQAAPDLCDDPAHAPPPYVGIAAYEFGHGFGHGFLQAESSAVKAALEGAVERAVIQRSVRAALEGLRAEVEAQMRVAPDAVCPYLDDTIALIDARLGR